MSLGYDIFSVVTNLSTSNATPAQITSREDYYPDTSGMLDLIVQVRRLSDGAVKLIKNSYVYKRGSTGDIAIASTLSTAATGTVGDLLALLTATITVTATDDDIFVSANGIAGTDLYWLCEMNGRHMVDYA